MDKQNANTNNEQESSLDSPHITNKKTMPFVSKKIIGLFIVLVITLLVSFLIINSQKNNNVISNEKNGSSNNAYLQKQTINYVTDTSNKKVDYKVNNSTRSKYTSILGNNNDKVTVMVYMIGSDLESEYGAATNDINEMIYSGIQNNINIVVETGGSQQWDNPLISNNRLERYSITSDGLHRLDVIENDSMTNPDTLSSFISYAAENFPANRYFLILWDHGGGSVSGYGYDENHYDDNSLPPNMIAKALKDGGVKFDIIGFDACLMGNLETALALEPYADYMVASEEVEPCDGWYYSNFIKILDENKSISSLDLAKRIIDDYREYSIKEDEESEITLSIIDLGELANNISGPIKKFSKAVNEKMSNNGYQEIADARKNTKEFSKESYIDQVDLIDLVLKLDVDGSEELADAIKASIKYNKTENITDSYGLAAYFPYSSLMMMNDIVSIYDNINIDKDYANVIKTFASYASSGQIITDGYETSGTSISDILSGNYYPANPYSEEDIYNYLYDSYNGISRDSTYTSIFGSGYEEWFDSSIISLISEYLGKDKIIDASQLKIIEKNGNKVISLSDSQWELISDILLNVYVDDGSGYIDMGLDNVFNWNDEGDLIVDYDGSWLAINDHLISYYMVSNVYIDENNYKTIGKTPAYLNGERVDIMISFTPENPYGIVEGAKKIYDNTNTQQKGLIKIKNGDEIDFICNYYKYDGTLDKEYQLGDRYIVSGDMKLNSIYLDNNYIYTYRFDDIYGNSLLASICGK